MTQSDVVVIGGGPAGCAAAIGLTRAGASVVLLERERGANAKVCGEFVSVEACAEARALGVDPTALGAAAIDRVRVSWRGATAESALPFRAASVSRAAFDEALLVAARDAGVRVERGARATAIDGTRVVVRRGDATEELLCERVVLATGKAAFAGFPRASRAPDVLGFKMHLKITEDDLHALGDAVELTLFAGGYAGMQRIEHDLVAFAIVVRREAFARLASWRALVASISKSNVRLASRLANARDLWPKPLAVSGVPYGFMYRDEGTARAAAAAVYRVGDQYAVIPSFTGDGMAIALVTGSAAARAIARGDSSSAYHAAMFHRLSSPMRVSGALSAAIATPLGRAALVWPARIVPGIFSFAAAHTRIPTNGALRAAELAPRDTPSRRACRSHRDDRADSDR